MIPGLKPYPAYRDSGVEWLGEVPERWEVLPALAAYKPKLVKNTGMIETTVLSLSYGRIIVKPQEKLHGLVPESYETYQIVAPGDIVVRTTDLQNDHISLRVGHSEHRGIITAAYMCLETRDQMTNGFGYLLLSAYELMKIIYGFGSGLRQSIDFDHIKRMPVPVPPPDEQSAIVRFLDHVDRRIRRYIRAKQKLIALLHEQRQAIIHRAVARGLDPDVPLKPSGVEWLGDVPVHWEVMSLGVAASVQTGPFGSQLHASEYVTDGTPVINPSHMRGGSISADPKVSVRSVKAAELGRHKLLAGDVVAARRGELGRCALVANGQEGWLCGTGSLRIRPRCEVLLPSHLVQVLSSFAVHETLTMSSIGATMDNLNASMMARLRIPVPPMQEQSAIAGYVARKSLLMRSASFKAQREIALLREYRTRLIADVVTGKLDVREAAARLPVEAEEPEPLDDTDTSPEDISEETEAPDPDALEEAEA